MNKKAIKVSSCMDTRNVALVVQIANKFSSMIKIQIEDVTINAKSIMGIIALGDIQNKDILILAEGTDSLDAIKEIEEFLTK